MVVERLISNLINQIKKDEGKSKSRGLTEDLSEGNMRERARQSWLQPIKPEVLEKNEQQILVEERVENG